MNNLNKTKALIGICLGFFLVIIDATIVNVALPAIGNGLHASLANLQWVIVIYILAFASLLLSMGFCCDYFGAKKAILFGLISFSFFSFCCAISTNIDYLILFRLFQGISGASLIPATLSLINTLYTNKKMRAKALGIWGAIGGIASALGPILGSVLISLFSWRLIFLINAPIALIAILLVRKIPSTAKNSSGFDFKGQMVWIMLIVLLSYMLIRVGENTLTLLSFTTLLTLLIVFAVLFIKTEYKSSTPMLNLSLFKNSDFQSATSIGFIISTGLYGVLFLLPIYFHNILHFNNLKIGLAIFPMMAFVALASYLSGRVIHINNKLPIKWGLSISFLGFILLGLCCFYELSFLTYVLPLIMIGFGVAFTMPGAVNLAMETAGNRKSGMSSAIFTTARQLGSLIGVATFGSITNLLHSIQTGLIVSLFISALLFGFGLIKIWR